MALTAKRAEERAKEADFKKETRKGEWMPVHEHLNYDYMMTITVWRNGYTGEYHCTCEAYDP